jgi:hypothetical protein
MMLCGSRPVLSVARQSWLPFLAVFALAAAGPLLILSYTDFDGLYGPDSYAYFDYAVGPLRTSLDLLAIPPPFFWPLGYPAMVAVMSYLTGPSPLAGQIVAVVCAGVVPVLTLALGNELLRSEQSEHSDSMPRAALLGGLVAALNGQLWQSAMVVMSDTAGLAAGTTSIWLLARYLRLQRSRHLVAGAVFWGIAILIRWAYALLLLPWVVALLWDPRMPAGLIVRARRLIMAGLIVLVVLGPELAVATRHHVRGKGQTTAFAGDLEIYRWNLANMARRRFETSDGELAYRLPNGLYYAVAPAFPAYFTPIGAPLVLVGLLDLIRRRSQRTLMLLGSWALVIYLFHGGAAWQNIRFTLAYLPPLAIFAGIGADRLVTLVGARRRAKAVLVATLVMTVMAAAAVQNSVRFIDRAEVNLTIVRWTEQQLPSSAILVTFQLTGTFRHHSRIDTRELFFETPVSLNSALETGRPVFLLVDTPSIDGQWRAQPPGVNVRWLRSGPGLVTVGQQGAFTLYRVGTATSSIDVR